MPGTPRCPRPRDLFTDEGYRRLDSWLRAQRLDLLDIQAQLGIGVPPSQVTRRLRPAAVAIGQMEMVVWAQARIWDCRQQGCVIMDLREPVESNLNLSYLANELRHYPDRGLYSHVIRGASLEADVELQTVLVPHLSSLPLGYHSVAKELRRLRNLSWYDFYWEPPFVPFYLNGQGAVARKMEPDRYRRSTEGGGPRQPTFDRSGLQAISLNSAARVRQVPAYFMNDHRESFVQWLASRGLSEAAELTRNGLPSDPLADPAVGGARYTKWPAEVKPTIEEVMQALAILKRAGALLDLDVYVFGDDFKDYFNQLRMQASDLWKLNIVFLEQATDVVHANGEPPDHNNRLIFVSDKRLGFGTHCASNIAQRFSYALLDIFRAKMDEVEHETQDAAHQRRAHLRSELKSGCYNTSRYREQKKGGIIACPQHRLYAAFVYTDDPIFLVVGAQRAIRAIRVWRSVVSQANLLTAIPEKRSLGSWTTWLGVVIVASLGVVFIPQPKLLRALAAIVKVLESGCEFHEYRSLCGLLEHFRCVILKGK